MQPAEIGSRIRQAREQRGLSLQHIASTTKISIAALKAIERSDFGHLPGGVFNTAYVRAYAAEVGLDSDELVREYRTRFEPGLSPAPGSGKRNRLYGRFPSHSRFVAAIVVSLAILICAGLLVSRYVQVREAAPSGERGLRANEDERPSILLEPATGNRQDAAGLD